MSVAIPSQLVSNTSSAAGTPLDCIIIVTMHNRCAADPKCRHWFVPPPKNVNETKTPGAIPLGETVCVLMDGNPDHKHINNSYCMGASAPAWYVLDPLVSHSLVLDEI